MSARSWSPVWRILLKMRDEQSFIHGIADWLVFSGRRQRLAPKPRGAVGYHGDNCRGDRHDIIDMIGMATRAHYKSGALANEMRTPAGKQ